MISRCLAVLLLLSGPAWADAQPVFSATGPQADAFGAAEGYPVGTAATMGQQKHLVGAYSHFDQILPTRLVPRAEAPSPLPRASQELTLEYTDHGQTHTLDDYLERHPTTGMLILRDRTIMFEHYRYDRTDTERFTSQSMAKTVLAMLVGIAVGEGKIKSIDDPASAYVKELEGTQFGRTPLRALLTMTSGMAFHEAYNGHDDIAKMSRDLRHDGNKPAEVLRQFDSRTAEPGKAFHYASVNSELLGLVLARATGMTVSDYLASRIWQKIGTEADASWVIDASGQELTYCCLNAVLRDWGRFGALLAQDGAWDGAQVIPPQWVLDATAPPPADSVLAPRGKRLLGYGYKVWTIQGARRQFALLGVHGQVILVDPASKLVLVHTAVRPQAKGDPMADELMSLWNALVAREGKLAESN